MKSVTRDLRCLIREGSLGVSKREKGSAEGCRQASTKSRGLSAGSFYESSMTESNFSDVDGSDIFCFALAMMEVRAASVIPL